jgi:Transglycosylase SLT domain
MMQVGVVTVDGHVVGVVMANVAAAERVDQFAGDIDGYVPEGRADAPIGGHGVDTPHAAPSRSPGQHHYSSGGREAPAHRPHLTSRPYEPGSEPSREIPAGKHYDGGAPGRPLHEGSQETDAAIRRASEQYGIDVNTMRGIASIESSMNPSSNANRPTQYKGLYQIGRNEFERFGAGGNVYSAEDNAQAAGRMFRENSRQFENRFGRKPTDTELYLMHQQGLGFYTRGAMTNISGNPYPGMRGPQTQESFEAGWGRELARRKSQFEQSNLPKQAATKPTEAMPPVQGLE